MKKQLSSAVLLLFVLISTVLRTESEMASSTFEPLSDKAENFEVSSMSRPRSVHIVYTQRPLEGEKDVESYNLRTLGAVLGSEEAARESLIYSYKTVACGFSAKLTPEQVEKLSKMPEVLQVLPSQTVKLHGGPGGIH